MQMIFCTSNLIGAKLIRAATWSDWSHVALIHGDEVIEATWPRVRSSSLTDVIARHSKHTIVDVPSDMSEEIISAARSQIGKPYDLSALFGLVVRRDWQNPDKWFCSELVAWAFQQGGHPLFRPDSLYRITPQHLWMLPLG